MIYLDETHLVRMGVDWHQTIGVIREAAKCLSRQDFAQPVKPYLRYRNPRNRIIAMPAFLGGNFETAGIKWIASFPDNVTRGLPRAHSVMVLNDCHTGEPAALINTALLSVIRTASVSGLIVELYARTRPLENIRVGIVGWGPIGRYHCRMLHELLGDAIAEIVLYDVRGIDPETIDEAFREKTFVAGSWREAYAAATVFVTCTSSLEPYIDLPPAPGSLHLNVSLRDYRAECCDYFRGGIIVDDWTEVCREKTDIEMMHLHRNLNREDTRSIADVVERGVLGVGPEVPVFFNPMGMAVFDIAIATYYCRLASRQHIGVMLGAEVSQ